MLVALLSLFGVWSCAPAAPAQAPAPKNHAAIEQIPVDLDVVILADLARIRQALDPALADVLARLLVSQARAPEEIVVAALSTTEKLWLGFRPSADPRQWDNVVILEGNYQGIATAQLSRVFGPPRDLGGGFRAYDDLKPGARTAPARLYTHLEEKWILASEAEMDAIERVVEGHHYERTLQPPERGVISIAADLSRVAPRLRQEAPHAAHLLETAQSLTGVVSLEAQTVETELRLDFARSEDAQALGAALRLFLRVIQVQELQVKVDVEGKQLLFRAQASLAQLERWIALSSQLPPGR